VCDGHKDSSDTGSIARYSESQRKAHASLTPEPYRCTNGCMAPEPKEERFQIRMSAEEREMLRTLADDAGESEATVVRQLIKAAFKAREPKKKR